MGGRMSKESRFWAKVDRSGDCWTWTAALGRDGYGRFGVGPHAAALAHRVSWEIAHGTPPGEACVLHRCDNRRCVRPEHLFLGTNADNSLDMVAKGRQCRGETRPAAKLTSQGVREMRERASAGETAVALAARFGVSRRTAQLVVCGDAWSHV